MRKISSRQTYWLKRIFPVLWFGILGTAFAGGLGAFLHGSFAPPMFPFLLIPIVMAVFGYVLMRALIFDLADEVLDNGDSLTVRKGEKTALIALADVINVNAAQFVNPPRIELTLRKDTPLGRRIVFSPQRPFTFNPFARIPIADDLIRRVEEARQRRRD